MDIIPFTLYFMQNDTISTSCLISIYNGTAFVLFGDGYRILFEKDNMSPFSTDRMESAILVKTFSSQKEMGEEQDKYHDAFLALIKSNIEFSLSNLDKMMKNKHWV